MKSDLHFVSFVAFVGITLVSTCAANAGLIHWYKFDETGATNYTAVDSAGSDNGTLADTLFIRGYTQTGGPLWTDGKINGALEFNRAHMNGVGLSDAAFGSSYTVSAWIKGTSFASGDENVIFAQYNSQPGRFIFEVRDGKLAAFSGGNGSDVPSVTAVGSTLSTNTWLHVAITSDNRVVTVYLNGNVDSTATFNYDAPATASRDIGGLAGGGYNYEIGFDGLIDDVRFYDTALTRGDIPALANVPEPSAVVLLGCGLFGLLAYAWRRRK